MREAHAGPNLAGMYDDQPYPLWIQVVALGVILAPTLALIAFRRRIGPMNAACALVVWGALAAGGEHGSWAMRLSIHERSWSEPHATVHYFMAGAYAAIAGVLLGVIALTLFREGRRSGWFVVLFVTLVGGGLELDDDRPDRIPVPPHRPLRVRRRVARRAGDRIHANLLPPRARPPGASPRRGEFLTRVGAQSAGLPAAPAN